MAPIYFEKKGAGRPLLFIPGWTLSHQVWDDVAPRFEGDFELILPDLRGTGKSPTGGKVLSIENDARDLMDIMMGRGRFSVIAHSRGVKVFLLLADLMPDMVGKSVLVGSAGFWPVNEKLDAEVQLVKTMAQKEGIEKAVGRMPEIVRLGPLSGGIESVRKLRKARSGYKGLDLVQEKPPHKHDYRNVHEKLKMPLLFVSGENDRLLPDIREASGWRGNCKLAVIPGAGHFPMIEAPGVFARIVSEYLKRE